MTSQKCAYFRLSTFDPLQPTTATTSMTQFNSNQSNQIKSNQTKNKGEVRNHNNRRFFLANKAKLPVFMTQRRAAYIASLDINFIPINSQPRDLCLLKSNIHIKS